MMRCWVLSAVFWGATGMALVAVSAVFGALLYLAAVKWFAEVLR